MYKLLLCLCYLRTRYLAFVCVVSVFLGVATLIVVNSVMSGFSTKMKSHMHGLSSDITLRTDNAAGFTYRTADIERALRESSVGGHITAMAPTVEVYALLQFQVQVQGQPQTITRHVKMIGIDPAKQCEIGKYGDYLTGKDRPATDCFELTQAARERFNERRRWDLESDLQVDADNRAQPQAARPPAGMNELGVPIPQLGARPGELPAPTIDPGPPIRLTPVNRLPGIVLGYAIAHYRDRDPRTGEMVDRALLKPGDDIFVATVGASGSKPVSSNFIVTEFFKSEMTEYDANVVFVPLDELQRLRGMDDRVNTIQIRLGDDIRSRVDAVHSTILPVIQDMFPRGTCQASSWWQQQGPIFAAIDIERGLLNILLFLIIGVAGFGVLAIFSMIVSEKIRDIGILKSLGASNMGVMGIFIAYGVLLGIIGCGIGTLLGLSITYNINAIEQFISKNIIGREVFDRKIYYFDSIPTNVEWATVLLVNAGALGIALVSSVLPAWRAARLQPVRALRFE